MKLEGKLTGALTLALDLSLTVVKEGISPKSLYELDGAGSLMVVKKVASKALVDSSSFEDHHDYDETDYVVVSREVPLVEDLKESDTLSLEMVVLTKKVDQVQKVVSVEKEPGYIIVATSV